MRKANFAACVNEKTPHGDAATWLLMPNFRNNNGPMDVQNLLDWHPHVRHNNMHILWGIYAGEEQKQTPEARSPPRRGDIKPDSRRGARSEVSRERVLR